MKYRIEIWKYNSITDEYSDIIDEYEYDNIEDILKWYQTWWRYYCKYNLSTFYVYKNNERLDFEEEYKLGFYL